MSKGKDVEKIAFPSSKNGGFDDTCSLIFEKCRTFTILKLVNGKVENVEVVRNPKHETGDCLESISLLNKKGVDSIVVGGMGRIAFRVCNDLGISILCGLRTVKVRTSLKTYLRGEFSPLTAKAVYNSILEKWSMW